MLLESGLGAVVSPLGAVQARSALAQDRRTPYYYSTLLLAALDQARRLLPRLAEALYHLRRLNRRAEAA